MGCVQKKFLRASFLVVAHSNDCVSLVVHVYVLDSRLQDGKKILKWEPRAQQGQFLGFSKEHSSKVCLRDLSLECHVNADFAGNTITCTDAYRKRHVRPMSAHKHMNQKNSESCTTLVLSVVHKNCFV